MLNHFYTLDGNLQLLIIFCLSILLLCLAEKIGEWRAKRRRQGDAHRVDALRLEMARGDRELEDRFADLLGSSVSANQQAQALARLNRGHQSAQFQYGMSAEEK